jgi:hypothetical protein
MSENKKVTFDETINIKEIKVNNNPIDLYSKKRRCPTELEFIMSINSNGKFTKGKVEGDIQFICHKNKCRIFKFKDNSFDLIEKETVNKLRAINFNGFYFDESIKNNCIEVFNVLKDI